MKLETRGITKSFDGTRIIEDISITLAEGELVCLLGVSRPVPAGQRPGAD